MTKEKQITCVWSGTHLQKIRQKCDIQLELTVLRMVKALPQHNITQKPFIPYMVSHGFDIHMVLYGI